MTLNKTVGFGAMFPVWLLWFSVFGCGPKHEICSTRVSTF